MTEPGSGPRRLFEREEALRIAKPPVTVSDPCFSVRTSYLLAARWWEDSAIMDNTEEVP